MTEEKKKGFFSRLFGADKGSCCSVRIVEEMEENKTEPGKEDKRKDSEAR